ncbi:hypothetical protein QQP08_015357 [Theobroma cacao]|uniref:Uncharacterized protein isoform 1 n=1 Tax=Theobroma cacao TaxID=3641 RepID=A0A061EXL3_THECC|nr:Uncharacterized protein TCM_021550 isoform 1 [Theobroma cacao]WRX22870.1 hypothetical protein QQP08_015357 [Theobroma cacao]
MKCVKTHCLPLPLRSPSPSPPLFLFGSTQLKTWSPQLSFSTPRRSRRSRLPRNPNYDNHNLSLRRSIEFQNSPDNPNVKLVLDFDQISSLSSSKLNRLISFSTDAFQDLRNLVQIDPDTRTLQLSCRKSTLQFLAAFLTCGFVIVFAFTVLVKLGLGLKARFRPKHKVIVRRDRSLGGREVIVGTKRDGGDPPSFRALDNPLSLSTARPLSTKTNYPRLQVQLGDKLPKWWPEMDSVPKEGSVFNSEYYQTQANRLIRAIIDSRLGGKDITEEDIIQLRQICRTSGVRVSIDTTNTRDSFYRVSVELVLNVCCRVPSQSTHVQIDGEDARQFLAGLAENIGLDNTRAARMVSAGVAARTRFIFLQAWAFEMQGKHSEAMLELSKICLVHRIFPPEESSPEMEMVARGLEKLLKVEQRELLMGMLVGVCSGESRRSAAEALGLVC